MTLCLQNLHIDYPGLDGAVKELTLEISPSEFLVLCGPPGCGKTAVIRMIAGLDTPSAGDILYNGKSMVSVPVKDRNFFLFSSAHTFHMRGGTLYQNLARGLRLRKAAKEDIDAAVRAAAQRLNLTEFLQTKLKRLDPLARAKAFLARMLLRPVSVVLLDEPLKGLAESLHESLMDCLVDLWRQLQVPFLYATIDTKQAAYLNQRIAVLRQGKLKQVGTIEELRTSPIDIFVEKFMQEVIE